MSMLERHADKWIPEPNTGCYIWIGCGSEKPGQRPRVRTGLKGAKKTALIQRLVCEETNGPPPTSKHHAAHNTPNGCIGWFCVNGAHMRWATALENRMDMSSEARKERGHLMAAARWDPLGIRSRRKAEVEQFLKGTYTARIS
jgi:hypothetical protein